MVPAQQQYMANLAGQRAQFGGAGQLGSARQALADTALAGQTQAAQMAAAAQVSRDIAQQRAQAGSTLASLGQGGLQQAIGAAGQGVTFCDIGMAHRRLRWKHCHALRQQLHSRVSKLHRQRLLRCCVFMQRCVV